MPLSTIVDAPIQPKEQTMIRLMRIGLWLTFAFVTFSMFSFLFLFFIDPVAPEMEVLSSEIVDHSFPSSNALDRPGVFEVRRVVKSSETKYGTLYAYFEADPEPPPPQVPGGIQVTPERIRFEIASVKIRVDKGIHRRDRYWQVPVMLPPGPYRYGSRVEFCNMLGKCVIVQWPEIPVTLSGHNWPPKAETENKN